MTRTVRSESISALIVQTGREMEQLKTMTVVMLAALKTAENWLPDAPIQRGALLKVRAAIAQAEAAGIKVSA